MSLKLRLIVMNFLEFAVWGAYLTSMGTYLGSINMGSNIGWFYSVQGMVSLFMPALLGIVADRWIPAQKLLSICHFIAAVFMAGVFYLCMTGHTAFGELFPVYTISIAFYMPTLALSNSVSYTAIEQAHCDTVKVFPPIRIFGTIGFIVSMWIVDGWFYAPCIDGFHTFTTTPFQFLFCSIWGIVLSGYALTLPNCPTGKGSSKNKGWVQIFGLDAFRLFGQYKMALFFIFSMLLGVSLQITNGFAGTFIDSFKADSSFSDCYFAIHSNLLISLSQISETICILLIPFFMKRFGIKIVMLISMLAWVFRFGLFAVGDPSFPNVIWFVFSMIIYGVAFDFFNVSGSLFVDNSTDSSIRSSAQGLFMIMTNGVGATIGTLSAQAVVNHFTGSECIDGTFYTTGDWSAVWIIFATYSLIVAVLFALLFKYRHVRE